MTTAPTPDRPSETLVDDPRPALFLAADQIAGLVGPELPLDAPTPCAGWVVDDLLAHLLTVHHRALRTGPDDRPTDVPHRTPRASLACYRADLAAAREQMHRVWADDAVLERTISVPWGSVPGREVGWGYTQELVVHAWDLATAVGSAAPLDPAPAASVLDFVRVRIPAEARPAPFGPVVEVGDDAGPYERLVGWLGRDPAWRPDLTASR